MRMCSPTFINICVLAVCSMNMCRENPVMSFSSLAIAIHVRASSNILSQKTAGPAFVLGR